VCGNDKDGETLTALLSQGGIHTQLVHDDRRRTTCKTRIIAQNQQIVRVDREASEPLDEHVVGELLETISRVAKTHDIIIISDYGKGVVNTRIMDALRSATGKNGSRPLLLVDPKPQNYDLYHGVDLLTPNAKEASEGAGVTICTGPAGAMSCPGGDPLRSTVLGAGQALFRRLGCAHLLITLGAQGMALFDDATRARRIPTVARTVFDVTGAGDTVIAALALALAAGADLLSACMLANHAAGIVVAQVGAATASPEDVLAAMEEHPAPVVETLLGNG
jgi:rfaE bifunctional protein kinase chain/domain